MHQLERLVALKGLVVSMMFIYVRLLRWTGLGSSDKHVKNTVENGYCDYHLVTKIGYCDFCYPVKIGYCDCFAL